MPFFDNNNVDITTEESHRRGWLLTWNPAYWPWPGFESYRCMILSGTPYYITWACSNTQPEIGDDVFIMKTGAQPRGIM